MASGSDVRVRAYYNWLNRQAAGIVDGTPLAEESGLYEEFIPVADSSRKAGALDDWLQAVGFAQVLETIEEAFA